MYVTEIKKLLVYTSPAGSDGQNTAIQQKTRLYSVVMLKFRKALQPEAVDPLCAVFLPTQTLKAVKQDAANAPSAPSTRLSIHREEIRRPPPLRRPLSER